MVVETLVVYFLLTTKSPVEISQVICMVESGSIRCGLSDEEEHHPVPSLPIFLDGTLIMLLIKTFSTKSTIFLDFGLLDTALDFSSTSWRLKLNYLFQT